MIATINPLPRRVPTEKRAPGHRKKTCRTLRMEGLYQMSDDGFKNSFSLSINDFRLKERNSSVRFLVARG